MIKNNKKDHHRHFFHSSKEARINNKQKTTTSEILTLISINQNQNRFASNVSFFTTFYECSPSILNFSQ